MDQHWKALLNGLGVGVVVMDGQGSLEFANRPAAELFDCVCEDELAGRWDAVKSRISASFAGFPDRLPAGARAEMNLPDEAAPRHLRMDMFPLDAGRRALVVRDGKSQAEPPDMVLMSRYHMLARLYRSLRHDLKAPLQALVLNLALLKSSVARNPSADPTLRDNQARYIGQLEDQLARLDGSLMSFLYQAIPPVQNGPTQFCLRELLQDIATLIGPQALKQRVEIEIQAGETVVPVQGQRDLLKQALLNLAVNALEAMAKGGRLTIKLEMALGRAIILMQDTGCGIPPDVMDRIWELNYTTRKTGSGVGLYVARSVIESHGGTIGVESRDGQGCCFTLTLPIALEGG